MHMTVRAMLEDAYLALKSGDEGAAKDVAQRDQDVDRLYWMVAKQYHLAHTRPPGGEGGESLTTLHNHRLIAKLIERIGDHAQRIAETVPSLGAKRLEPRLLKEIETANVSAIAILDKAFHALVTGDVDEANEAIDARVAHQRLVDGLSHHVAAKRGEELLALAAIADSLGRTAGYATDIAEIAINQAMGSGEETP
jgi:phosphate uptake regulator